jgi:hypothetical protein
MGPGGEHVHLRLWVCRAENVWVRPCWPRDQVKGQPPGSKLYVCQGLLLLAEPASGSSLHMHPGCVRIIVRLLFCS